MLFLVIICRDFVGMKDCIVLVDCCLCTFILIYTVLILFPCLVSLCNCLLVSLYKSELTVLVVILTVPEQFDRKELRNLVLFDTC